jgi:hypothetical protein
MPDRYNSRIAKIIGKLNGATQAFAVTVSSTCTLYNCAEYQVSPAHRRHEACHKRQYAALGWRFLPIYIWELRRGYRMNKFEVEARAAE